MERRPRRNQSRQYPLRAWGENAEYLLGGKRDSRRFTRRLNALPFGIRNAENLSWYTCSKKSNPFSLGFQTALERTDSVESTCPRHHSAPVEAEAADVFSAFLGAKARHSRRRVKDLAAHTGRAGKRRALLSEVPASVFGMT